MRLNIYALAAALLLPLAACEDLDTEPQGSTVTANRKRDIQERLPVRASA